MCDSRRLDGGTISVLGDTGTKLINSGTISSFGTVFIGTSVTGTGTMTIGNHSGVSGSLETQRDVSTGQSIMLQAGTLTIDDTHDFFATIIDFDARDKIVLKGVDVTSVNYVNGKLSLDGGADGALHFRRPNGVIFDTNSFMLSHSGNDTIITTPAQS